MDEIVDLEKKINDALGKIRLALTEKKKFSERCDQPGSDVLNEVESLDKENRQLKKQFTVLRNQHESDLITVDKLVSQLNAILEDKNG